MNDDESLRYQTGFGNHFATEAEAGALPQGRNSPQRVEHGLYAELLSGTAFTVPRAENLRTWTYRMRPSAVHKPFARLENNKLATAPVEAPPPLPISSAGLPCPCPRTR